MKLLSWMWLILVLLFFSLATYFAKVDFGNSFTVMGGEGTFVTNRIAFCVGWYLLLFAAPPLLFSVIRTEHGDLPLLFQWLPNMLDENGANRIRVALFSSFGLIVGLLFIIGALLGVHIG